MPPIPYQDLRFNEAIPNTMARSALYFLAALTRTLPPSSHIVEAGSLYGCTSWVLSQNAPAGASVICIDPFEHIDWMNNVRERYPDCPPVSREAFQRFTADCGNITIVQGPSPAAYTDPTPVDLFFEDATHKNPVVADNLAHFARLLKPGGILCGDDFSMSFPDVIAEVVKLQAEWRTPLLVRDRVWAMTKPTPDGRNTILDRLQTVLGSDIVVSAGTSGGLRQETSYFAWPGTLWSRQHLTDVTATLAGFDGVDLTLKLWGAANDKPLTVRSGETVALAPLGAFRGLVAALKGPRSHLYELRYQAIFIHPKTGAFTYGKITKAGEVMRPREKDVVMHALRMTVHGAIVPLRNQITAADGALQAAAAIDAPSPLTASSPD